MNILITGATGFVGRHLVRKMSKTTNEVFVTIRRSQPDFQNISNVHEIIIADGNWKNKIKEANPDVVIHLASFLTSQDDEATINRLIESNISFGTQLLDALKGTSLKYFINTGTFAEYYNNDGVADPAYLYAATKTAFKSILGYFQGLLQFKLVHVVPYTIYGGVDSQKKLIDIILESIGSLEVKKMSPGEQQLDFIHIDDIISFYDFLLNHLDSLPGNYTEIHLGTGTGTSPKQVAQIVSEITGQVPVIEWGGVPYRQRDIMKAIANRNLPMEIFNWKPSVSLKEGIGNYIKLLNEQPINKNK